MRTADRIVELLRELGRPAGTGELASALGLHPTGVRVHLDRLRAAGIVGVERVVHGRGRPCNAWSLQDPAADPPRAATALTVWLAEALPASAPTREVGREAGSGLARERESGAPREVLLDLMASLGFGPREVETAGLAGQCIVLGNCPYRDAVEVNRDAVCGLHRGLVEGVLDHVAPDARLTRFVPHDPHVAGCELEITYGSEAL